MSKPRHNSRGTKGEGFPFRHEKLSPVPNPMGRADIALTRLLHLGVSVTGDPALVALHNALGPYVQPFMTMLAGPRTPLGRASFTAVAMLHEVKRQLDAAEARATTHQGGTL